jgi:hypothetical protein
MTRYFILSTIIAGGIAAGACSSDKKADDGHGGSAGSGGGGPMCAMQETNCAAYEDKLLLPDGGSATFPVTTMGMTEMKTIADIARGCFITCLTDPTEACINGCIQDTLGPGVLSEACTLCPTRTVLCGVDNMCTTLCVNDPAAPECTTCVCGGMGNKTGTNCIHAADCCSGLPPSKFCAAVGL